MNIMYIEDVELTGGGYVVDEVISKTKKAVYTQGKLFVGQAEKAFPAVAKFTRHNKGVIIGFNEAEDCDFCCEYYNKLISSNGKLARSILTRTAERILVAIIAFLTAFNTYRCLRYVLADPFFDRSVFIIPVLCLIVLVFSIKYVFFKPGAMHLFSEDDK